MKFKDLENSLYINFYFTEIFSISQSILDYKIKLQQAKSIINPLLKKPRYMDGDSKKVIEIITNILLNCWRLDKLFRVSSKINWESELDFKFKKERAKLLSRKLLPRTKSGSFEFNKTWIRNSIEHYEERLDSLMKKILDDTDLHKVLIFNIVITDTDIYKDFESQILLKVYNQSTNTFYLVDKNLKNISINLNSIFNEVEIINSKSSFYINQNSRELWWFKIPPHNL